MDIMLYPIDKIDNYINKSGGVTHLKALANAIGINYSRAVADGIADDLEELGYCITYMHTDYVIGRRLTTRPPTSIN